MLGQGRDFFPDRLYPLTAVYSISPRSAGNGNLMRLAPIPLFYYSSIEQVEAFAIESSKTTHGAPDALMPVVYSLSNCFVP